MHYDTVKPLILAVRAMKLFWHQSVNEAVLFLIWSDDYSPCCQKSVECRPLWQSEDFADYFKWHWFVVFVSMLALYKSTLHTVCLLLNVDAASTSCRVVL